MLFYTPPVWQTCDVFLHTSLRDQLLDIDRVGENEKRMPSTSFDFSCMATTYISITNYLKTNKCVQYGTKWKLLIIGHTIKTIFEYFFLYHTCHPPQVSNGVQWLAVFMKVECKLTWRSKVRLPILAQLKHIKLDTSLWQVKVISQIVTTIMLKWLTDREWSEFWYLNCIRPKK